MLHVLRQNECLQEFHAGIAILSALRVEVEVVVLDFTVSEEVGVEHDDFLPLVECLFEALAPANEVDDGDLAAHVVLLQPLVVLEH